jgi:hypothetical protein
LLPGTFLSHTNFPTSTLPQSKFPNAASFLVEIALWFDELGARSIVNLLQQISSPLK